MKRKIYQLFLDEDDCNMLSLTMGFALGAMHKRELTVSEPQEKMFNVINYQLGVDRWHDDKAEKIVQGYINTFREENKDE